MSKPRELARRRPAETGTAGLAVVVAAILQLTGHTLTSDQTAAIIVVLGAVPAAITRAVNWYRSLRS